MKGSKFFKRAVSVFTVFIFLTTLIACGENKEVKNETSTVAQQTTVAEAAQKAKDEVKMTIAWNESWTDTASQKFWPTDIAKEIFKQTGVTFDIMGMDDEKFKVLMAGGDLPDMVIQTDSRFHKQLIEGGHVIALDALLETNGQDILKNCAESLSLSKKFSSNGTGNLYFLNTKVGPDVPLYNVQFGYVVRWDYYKELGYPKFSNLDEFLPILAEMQKRHPKTEDGSKVYAMGYFNDWGLWAYWINLMREGYYYMPYAGYAYTVKKSDSDEETLINVYSNTNSPLWNTIRFMNKANKLGILDPDSFTMKFSDWFAKASKGQYLTNFASIWSDPFNSELNAKDPNNEKGYICIPVEGTVAPSTNAVTKTGNPKNWSITKNCKNPERAMDLINFFYSKEGVRTTLSGIKGTQWDIVDGKPQLLPATVDILNGPEDGKSKVGFEFFSNNIGLSQGTICDDGSLTDLRYAPEILKARVKGVEKDFCKYYGIEFPMQIWDKMFAEGKISDLSKTNVDIGSVIAQPTDEIKRIDAKMDELVTKAIPKLALAKSDAEFESIQQKLLADLKEAGSEASEAWWTQAFNDAKAAFKK